MAYINQGSSDQIEFKAECVSVLHKIALNIVFYLHYKISCSNTFGKLMKQNIMILYTCYQ